MTGWRCCAAALLRCCGLGAIYLITRSDNICPRPVTTLRRQARLCIGTEHLLMGMLREEGGIAARVLREHGITFHRQLTAERSIYGSSGAAASF